MALTAGQLMATLSLDMAPFEAGLTRAKERARQDGAQIAMHLRVEPEMEAGGYTGSLNRMVEEAKKAAARIHGEMSTIHMDPMDLRIDGTEHVRSQLRGVIDDTERLRRLVGAPLILGAGEDQRLREELTRLQEQMDRLRRSAATPIRVASSASSVPNEGATSSSTMGKLGGGMLRNAGYMAGSAAIFAVGAALVSTIKSTADFETEMNTLGAVAGPVGMAGTTIAQVSAKALALGADFTIANASASDAAVTMTELVKGGLSAAQAMDAAKGSLQLASAGGISFVQAADLESAALAQFALKGTDAGKVADILANSAHAARGTVGDLGTALTYAGLNAHQAGWSLKETATTLAEFAKFGLTGSLGGTTLKDFTMRVEKAAVSTGAAGDAYKQLGLDVYNQDGTLKSAAQISDQLATAHKKLAPMIYNSAMQTVFGARAINGANIMAMQGSKGWNELADKISKGAGAAGFSAARMQGLGGAFANLKNQVETAQIQLGEKFSPALQRVVNDVAAAVPKIANFMAGPSIGTGFSHLGDFFAPLVNGAKDLVAKAMPYISDFVHSIGQGFGSIIDFIHPVITAIGDFWKKAADNGSVAAVANVFDEVGTAFKNAAKFLVPVGDAIGHVIGWIGGLGTFGTVLGTVGTAMLAFKLVSPLLASVARMVPGFSAAEGAVKSFGATYRALGSTGMGSVSAALGAAAQGAANFGKGLLAAFGGPVGIAIMAVTTAIAWFSTRTDSAAKATTDFTGAIDANTGALEQNALHVIAEKVKDAEAAYVAAGGKLGDYTLAVSGNAEAQKRVSGILDSLTVKQITASDDWKRYGAAFGKIGVTAQDVATAFAGGGHAIEAMHGKISDGTKVLAKMGIDSTNLSAGFDRMGGAAKGSGDEIRTYKDDLSTFSGQQKSVTDTVAAAAAAQRTLNASVGDGTLVTGALGRAWSSVQHLAASAIGPMSGVEVRIGEIGRAAKLAGDDTSGFYEIVKGAKGKPDTIVTPMTQAFADYKQAVSDADTTTSAFITTMDRLAGRNVTVEDAMRNNAAAARGIGAAGRKQQADAAALQDAKDALTKAQAGHVGTADESVAAQDKHVIATDNLAKAEAALQKLQASGKATATGLAAAQAKVDVAQRAATKTGDAWATAAANVGKQTTSGTAYADALAAAQLKVADAQNTLADSADGIAAANETYQKTAAMNVLVLGEQADRQHGFAYAVKIGTAEMARQRQAFIDQQPAADIASGAAARLADHYGLIPKNVLTLLTGDPKLAVEAAKIAKAAYDKATKDRITTLRVSTADAIADAAKYGMELSRMPKSIVTKFNADLATARKEGLNLYDVYNSTARKWVAQFLTPDSAAAQITAGNVVRGYDKARGTWTANLKAIDLASPAAQAAKKHMDDVAQAKYEAKILADTSGAFTKAQNLKQAADIAAAARLLVIDGEDKATAYIQAVKAELDSVQNKTVTLTVDANGTTGATTVHADGSFVTKGGGQGHATGGPIHGPGTGTSDDVPIWASDGEFMHTAKDYARNKAAIHYIHAGGTIPEHAVGKFAAGGVIGPLGGLHVNMTEQGDISGALNAVKAIYANADKSATAANSVAKAATAMAGTIPMANGGGTEQWRALADHVAAAHHEDIASVQVMLNQMSRESSGNPAAINLTDINAINGHPSVGLLQFIPDTFNRYADPGFNTNIYDPESQMRAWYNYINATYGGYVSFGARGYGAYATGDLIQGPGTGTSDSVVIRASKGEGINTEAAMRKPANVAAMRYMNSGGTIPGFAQGGLVLPSTSSLAGIPAAQTGARLSEVINALQLLTQAVTDARTNATDKRALENTAMDNLVNTRIHQADLHGTAKDRLASAQAVQRSETSKTSAHSRAIDRARVASAAKVLATVTAVDRATVAKAEREWRLAQRTRISYDAAASAAERFQTAQQHAFRSQQAIAAHLDSVNNSLTNTQANVANLKSNRAQVMGGISSTVSGFDSGILGHPDTRNTIANMIKGQLYDVAQAQKFNVNIVKDRKLGLSNESLQQIAAAGVDGGGSFAAAIAKGTPAQIKQLNALTLQMHRIGDNVGATVGGAMYDNGIKIGEGMIHGLMSTEKQLENALWRYSMHALASMKKALKIRSPSQKFHDEVGVQIGLGVRNGINSQIPAVARATSNLVTVPHTRSASSGGSSSSGDIARAVESALSDWSVQIDENGIGRIVKKELVGLGHAIRKVKAQG